MVSVGPCIDPYVIYVQYYGKFCFYVSMPPCNYLRASPQTPNVMSLYGYPVPMNLPLGPSGALNTLHTKLSCTDPTPIPNHPQSRETQKSRLVCELIIFLPSSVPVALPASFELRLALIILGDQPIYPATHPTK